MEHDMHLYHIQYDSVSYYVEAESMQRAIDAWFSHVQQEWGADFGGDEQPDSCALVHDEPVIRAPLPAVPPL